MSKLTPFHVAIPVYDLQETCAFYRDILQCEEGRSSANWVDLNFYGHQFVLHMKPRPVQSEAIHHNPVDGHDVPVPHYGVVLDWADWEALRDRLQAHEVSFVIEPYIRFEGQPGEQATMFFLDPSGNALEFKAFKDMEQLFAK
ncbi:MAG: VOC family protein [Bacteroidota bacterium]